MKQLLTLMMLVILGAVGVRTQQPSPYTTGGLPNGLGWRNDSHRARLLYVAGALDGFIRGAYRVLGVPIGAECSRSVLASFPSWFHSTVSAATIAKEMDAFYEDGANVSLPTIDAFQYSAMKLTGATKQELDDFRATAFEAATKPITPQRALSPR